MAATGGSDGAEPPVRRVSTAFPGVDRRTEGPADLDFVRALYASTRVGEMALLEHWTDGEKTRFLHSQFDAQRQHYRAHYPDARYDLLLDSDAPIGRFYVAELPGDLRLMDIALLPAWRNRGIGSALVRELMDTAASRSCRVSLHVESGNPARRLYRRLGFEDAGEAGFYLLMCWSAPT